MWKRIVSFFSAVIGAYAIFVAWNLYSLAHADLTKLTDWNAVRGAFYFPGFLAYPQTPIWADILFLIVLSIIFLWASNKLGFLIIIIRAIGISFKIHASWKWVSRIFLVVSSITLITFLLVTLIVHIRIPQTHHSSGKSTPLPTASPALKQGTILYQADWSKGLDGWKPYIYENYQYLSDQGDIWSANESNGLMTNRRCTLNNFAGIDAPNLGNLSNYAVIVRLRTNPSSNGFISINVSQSPEKHFSSGYGFVISSDGIYLSELDSGGDPLTDFKSFVGYNSFHVYRIEVRKDNIKGFVDGKNYIDAHSEIYQYDLNPSGSQISIGCDYGASVQVTDFQVVVL